MPNRPSGVSTATLEAMGRAAARVLADDLREHGDLPNENAADPDALVELTSRMVGAALKVALASGELVPRQEREEAVLRWTCETCGWTTRCSRCRARRLRSRASDSRPGAALSGLPEEETG